MTSTLHARAPRPVQLLARLLVVALVVVVAFLAIIGAWHLGAFAVVAVAAALWFLALRPLPAPR
jgi:uncharacterized membrane protein